MFSFGLVHPDPFSFFTEPCSKGKQTPIWRKKKEHFMGSKTIFFKSNMDVLTVLSIWGHWLDRDIMYVLNGLFRYKKLMVDIQANVAC